MLVYGKAHWTGDPRHKLAALAELLREMADERPGIGRHGALVAALIEAGELVQGIADADFRDRGPDALSPSQASANHLLLALARSVWKSWRTGFAAAPGAFDLNGLAATALPDSITTRWAEGFAFYALYPESYAIAAARAALGATTRVIGIRSIGAPLGAMVAAGLGSRDLRTIRPVGHPFRRELPRADRSGAGLITGDPAAFAIVDEGPGLSGSSFGAVIDLLCECGVAQDRISLFPSHPGAPGPQADARHRARWPRMRRHVVSFEEVGLADHGVAAWVADLVGPAEAPLEEISGGRWRVLQGRDADAWPPVNAQQEKRKFLLRASGGTWLLKFVGLGRAGRAKLDRARALHAAGFTPPVAGYRHGFLVERWLDEARPLDLCRVSPDDLTDQVGRYLGFRARCFASGPDRGAGLADLLAMARHNVEAFKGADWARCLDRWPSDRLSALERKAHPVEIDGRMQAWEFLVQPGGHLLKCDALDHHAAHDLVGCQDIAWDVAGAGVELALSEAAQARLAGIVGREAGRPVDPELLAFLTPCYLAFQLGAASLAADAAHDPAEALRLGRARARYAEQLERLLRP
ncbi:hypothetical protein [Methylobacterium soli]|uniref:Uncharacterized protein n=1 Tax=Methylobacterium soli TaxID=553447 RepID=A0A6L3T704_9HYPH|nr:hypothetical protein [Methylobacterium soli]KAB1080976.1 hypothetical protein F6X53_04695 [Methylobacterium soli]GJE41155.1 hypothetical protein AEGHOMDF_0317 [Methylobacterium soli]